MRKFGANFVNLKSWRDRFRHCKSLKMKGKKNQKLDLPPPILHFILWIRRTVPTILLWLQFTSYRWAVHLFVFFLNPIALTSMIQLKPGLQHEPR